MPNHRRSKAASLAHDRPAVAQRLERASRGGRPQARGLLARPSGPIDGREEEPRATAHSRELDEIAEAGRAIRREWPTDSGTQKLLGQKVRRSPKTRRLIIVYSV